MNVYYLILLFVLWSPQKYVGEKSFPSEHMTFLTIHFSSNLNQNSGKLQPLEKLKFVKRHFS